MKLVYLDQNKWIDLARARFQKSADRALRDALAFLTEATGNGAVALLLSAIHYMETAKIRNPQRRERLGLVMWELSRGRAVAPYGAVLSHEIEQALARRFPKVASSAFRLLGSGVAHAFGMQRQPYQVPEPFRSQLNPMLVEAFEGTAQGAIEKSLLTGMGPKGMRMPPFGPSSHNYAFKNHLETLHPDLLKHPRELWDDALYGISLADILVPLNAVLQRHNLQWANFTSLGKEGMKEFIEDLPSRRVDLQLHRQVIRNPKLKPRITDLEDWGGLGPAVTYSDIVVCEKHFASLVLRGDFRPHAEVLTDIRQLANVA